MDTTTYHYPPELFNLLVDAIPRLCKSKKLVIAFFAGAGVDQVHLQDMQRTVSTAPDSITKRHIVQTVLGRINDAGDKTLRARREVLKRVTEFEDFTACWEGDRLEAMGLVAQVRKVVGTKDAFTRMNLERERERQEKQAKRASEQKALRRREQEVERLKAEFFALIRISDAGKRGKALENVLNQLFRQYGVLVREAFHVVGSDGEGITEQIDGVVEIDGYLYLVEMKWWEKPLGKNDIAPHIVSVFNRGQAGGIYISNSGFSEPAVVQCREALTQKTIVLCELQEIVLLLERRDDLGWLLKQKIQAAILDKTPFYRPYA